MVTSPARPAGVLPRSFRRSVGERLPGPFLVAVLAAALLLAGLTCVLASHRLTPDTKSLVSDLVTPLLAVATALSSTARARRCRGRDRLAWALMAWAGGLWSLGEFTWVVEEYARVTSPVGTSDVCYLLAMLPAAAALLVFPPPQPLHSERVRALLGALVVGDAVVFVGRRLAIGGLLGGPSEGGLAGAVAYAYPVGDLVLASLALIVLVRAAGWVRLHLTLLIGGFLLYTVSDVLYAVQGARDSYVDGSLLDLGWAAGYALFGLAPLAPDAGEGLRPARRSGVRRRARSRAAAPRRYRRQGWSSLVIYGPVLGAIVVAASLPSPKPDPVLIVSGLALLVLFGARQFLMGADNGRLRADLEAQVGQLRQRTTELRQLALQNERVVQSVVDGVCGVDASGRITFANARAVAILGRPATELVGLRQGTLFAEPVDPAAAGATPDRSWTAADMARALTDGTVVPTARSRFLRGDGSVLPVELAVGPILEGDRVTGAVIVFRDVSDRLAVEKMKNEFVSVVSHELKTPLTAIRGSLALLAGGTGGELTTHGRRMVTIALDSSERLTRLINDMLDLERIEAGSLAIDMDECDVAGLVETATDQVDTMARQHQVSVVVGPLDGSVRADRDRVVQTLTNLLSNAVKFSPAGGVVTVGAVRREGEVEFSVADRGRGVPVDKQRTIFERFEQVEASDARVRGGTGLGLSISRDIVALHGGRIWVESVVGQGATFRFTLPTAAPGAADRPAADPRGDRLQPGRLPVDRAPTLGPRGAVPSGHGVVR